MCQLDLKDVSGSLMVRLTSDPVAPARRPARAVASPQHVGLPDQAGRWFNSGYPSNCRRQPAAPPRSSLLAGAGDQASANGIRACRDPIEGGMPSQVASAVAVDAAATVDRSPKPRTAVRCGGRTRRTS
jgi:hypothetical protein